jgi:hypothetical protein
VLYIGQCESIKPIFMSHHPRSYTPTLALHLIGRSAHLNILNKVKFWHKSAPLLITAVTILGMIVVLRY